MGREILDTSKAGVEGEQGDDLDGLVVARVVREVSHSIESPRLWQWNACVPSGLRGMGLATAWD
jgi:hypothetical protein